MNSHIRRIAINTGGGDAPGLNAVIRAVVLAAEEQGWEVYGIERSYDGLFEADGVYRLDRSSVRGITHLGGTILGTTNRGNPLHWPVTRPDGTVEYEDRSQAVIDALKEHEIDALVAIGGDGSLSIAHALFQQGLKVVGVPKTIDNDLAATNLTFGFQTAVETATDAIDRLHSTAQAHQRVMVIELMGRNAGWIALYSGVAGTADVILIPEIPYDMDAHLRQDRGPLPHGAARIRHRGGGRRSVSQGRRAPLQAQRRRARSAWAASPKRSPWRSSSAPAGRPARWSSATSSGAAGPTPTTASWRFASAPPR